MPRNHSRSMFNYPIITHRWWHNIIDLFRGNTWRRYIMVDPASGQDHTATVTMRRYRDGKIVIENVEYPHAKES